MTQNRIPALPPTATFGDNLGYRFTVDVVELNADIQCSLSAPIGQDWALQLWADNAIKIAELPLGPLFPDDRGRISVSGTAPARIPAGERFHALSLSLMSGAHGVYDCFHDRREFACLQRFQQLCLKGDIECRFDADEVIIDIAGIENPRDADNISGTLALEVWSLDAPYEDDAWSGVLIASLTIGCLNGQSAWSNDRFVAPAAPLPATGHLTLMLREWTPDGYATRDYRPLDRPINPSSAAESSPIKEPSESSAEQVSAAESSPIKEPSESSAGQASVAEISAVQEPSESSAEQASVAEISAVQEPSESSAAQVQVSAAEVSVVEELSESSAAQASIAERSAAAPDERRQAKGMGFRFVEKVRRYFGL